MPYQRRRQGRRSIRLRGYDYTSPGAYYITICVRGGMCLLGDVVGGEMHLNGFGEIVDRCWRAIPEHFAHVVLDAYVVMPNHLHGIIVIVDALSSGPRGGEAGYVPSVLCAGGHDAVDIPSTLPPRRGDACVAPADMAEVPSRPRGPEPGSVGAVVGSFKSAAARQINQLRGTPGAPFWQRNYHDHVVRNEADLERIRAYIRANPSRWPADHLYHR